MAEVCVTCLEKLPLNQDLTSPRGLPYENGRIVQVDEKYFHVCFTCQKVHHLACIKDWHGRQQNCPQCRDPSHAPEWHRQLYQLALVAAGLVGFAVMSHVTAAAVRLPQRVVWARERLYFGLPRQFFAAWTSLFLGFPLGSAFAMRCGMEYDVRTRRPAQPVDRQHPLPIVRPRWKHDWTLVAGSWVALWGSIIAMQTLFGLIATQRSGVPLRNLWVLDHRMSLPEIVRHKIEMAITLGNVVGGATAAIGFTVVWNHMQPTVGDTAQKRKDRYWRVATTMGGLVVASHLLTIILKECACIPRRQAWHAWAIAKLFKGDPPIHSRSLAIATAVTIAPIVFVSPYLVWVGRD